MYITIRIIYKGYTSRIMQRGEFPINQKWFREYPNKEAARIANVWLKQIQRETHVSEIIEVIYNDDHDITELVKKLDDVTLGD